MPLLLFIMLAGALAPTVRAQAWVQSPGGLYAKLSYGETSADEQFDATGRARPYAAGAVPPAFRDQSAYLYAETGVSRRVTLAGLLAYKSLRTRDGRFTYDAAGLSTLMLAVRADLRALAGLDGSRHALAVQPAVMLPLGYARDEAPALGGGQVDVQITVHYGASLYPAPLYAQVGAGYRHRSSYYALTHAGRCAATTPGCTPNSRPDYGDEALFSSEIGYTDGTWLLVQGLVQGVWAVQAPDAGLDASGRLAVQQRFVKAGMGATVYPVAGLGLSVLYQTTLAGQATTRATDVFFGIEIVRR